MTLSVDHAESVCAHQLSQECERSHERYVPEKYQLGILTHYLRTHGFDYVTEGRIFCYPIDILCVRGEVTVAIEMKAGDVARGIEQAWRNSDFVDFSYLAIWEEQDSSALREKVAETPVGLLTVGEEVTQVSPPRKTTQQLCSKTGVITTVRDHVRDDPPLQQSE